MALTTIDDRGLKTPIDLLDDEKIRFGTGNDIEIYHSSGQSYITNSTGNFRIDADNLRLRSKTGNEAFISASLNGSVELYYNDTRKLYTDNGGVVVEGNLYLSAADNYKALFGASQDLEIYHDGSHSWVHNDTGYLRLAGGGSGVTINNSDNSEAMAGFIKDGAVDLYYDNSKKFETASYGAQVSGNLVVGTDAGELLFTNPDGFSPKLKENAGALEFYTNNALAASWGTGGNLAFQDSKKVELGTGADLQIYHNGTNSYIVNGTGNLELQNSTRTIGLKVDNFHVNSGDDQEAIINGEKDGPARLYYNGVKKLETTANGIKVPDGERVAVGDSQDAYFYHNGAGSDGAISNTVGNFLIYGGGNNIYLRPENTENSLIAKPNGAVELYYDNSKVFETYSSGITVLAGEGLGAQINIYADQGDDNADKWRFDANSSGDFYLQNYAGGSWETNIKTAGGSGVELRYNDSKKFYTYTEGVKVDGYIKALFDVSDSHWGDNTSNWHHIQNKQDDAHSCIFENSSDSTPYGNLIYFTDCIPDNNTQTFLEGHDTSAIRFKIYSDGDLWNHDNVYTGSDQTLKENIVDATPKLEDLKKLKVRNFNWKAEHFPEKSKKKQLGFIAQEVEEVFPALVSEHDIAPGTPGDGHVPVIKKAIKQAWDPIIIKAMQELIEKVETLEAEVAALKG